MNGQKKKPGVKGPSGPANQEMGKIKKWWGYVFNDPKLHPRPGSRHGTPKPAYEKRATGKTGNSPTPDSGLEIRLSKQRLDPIPGK